MQYTKLDSTGLDVSRICLGCMSYGEPGRGRHPWTLPEDESRPHLRRALELGINFFDTADQYSDGSSEEIVGRALREFANRDEIVLASKVFYPLRGGPNGMGLSRKAIMQGIDNSYQIHRFDPHTPVEETMEALHDVVKAGKARYIGASSMYAWQFSKLQYTASQHGWTRFVTMQNHYNLLYREEEREMIPLCRDLGVGLIPWSPLARGRLTRGWDTATSRSGTDPYGEHLYDTADQTIVERVGEVADARGAARAHVALAWVLQQPGVSAPIIGATRTAHLDDAVAALDITLTAEEIAALEQPYTARPIRGHE
jgi:1-deoxyxylulose-5-phosphate synthase